MVFDTFKLHPFMFFNIILVRVCNPALGGIMKKLGIFVGKIVIALAICVLVTTGLKMAFDFTTAKATEVKVAVYKALPKREVPKRPLNLEESIAAAAYDFKVDPLILKVIVDKESTNGHMRALYRFEPNLYSRLRSEKSYRSLSDSEIRMLASSHGAFHILGLTAERECQLHFSRLYDVEISARCAAKIIKNIDNSVSEKATNARLKEVFRRYNGAGKAAEEYANDAMGRLAAILYQRVRG
jgi:hypothetical protein